MRGFRRKRSFGKSRRMFTRSGLTCPESKLRPETFENCPGQDSEDEGGTGADEGWRWG